MFKKLAKLFKEPQSGWVKLKFIALDELQEPYEDTAQVPWHDEYRRLGIEAKFKHFMSLKGHTVVEITILEVTNND